MRLFSRSLIVAVSGSSVRSGLPIHLRRARFRGGSISESYSVGYEMKPMSASVSFLSKRRKEWTLSNLARLEFARAFEDNAQLDTFE